MLAPLISLVVKFLSSHAIWMTLNSALLLERVHDFFLIIQRLLVTLYCISIYTYLFQNDNKH